MLQEYPLNESGVATTAESSAPQFNKSKLKFPINYVCSVI